MVGCETVAMTSTLRIAGLANARDLGGLLRADGTKTPSGVFVRAERLDLVDASGWDELQAAGVRTIIDLRRPDEHSGDVPSSITRTRVDLDGDDVEFWAAYEADGRWGTPLYYLDHLRELPERLGDVLTAIATADDGAILFHCSAGWDRTGLVSAVLLRALDVTTEAAVADYLASFGNAGEMEILHGRSFEVAERHEILRRFGHTPDSAFRDMYEHLDLDAWFRAADVDRSTRAVIETWRGAAPANRVSR